MGDPAGNASKVQHHRIALTWLFLQNLFINFRFNDHQPVPSWKVSKMTALCSSFAPSLL